MTQLVAWCQTHFWTFNFFREEYLSIRGEREIEIRRVVSFYGIVNVSEFFSKNYPADIHHVARPNGLESWCHQFRGEKDDSVAIHPSLLVLYSSGK